MTRQGAALSFGMRVALLALGLAALLLPFGGPGSLDRAEPYFVDAARAMVESGDWLVPHYRGEPFFDKPVLGYWMIAVVFRIFGYSAAVARLGPALFAILTLLATVGLGILVAGRRAGLFAGAVLATTVPFVNFGRIAMADMPMTFFSTAAIALALAAWTFPPRQRLLLPALGAALGLGFAAKGPVAVLLPGLAILALAWQKRRERPSFTTGALLSAALLFGVLGFSWFLAIYLHLGSGPLRFFFLQENLQRFAGAAYDARRSPFFYVLMYLSQAAPWSLFLPAALLLALRARAGAPEARAKWIPLALLLMLLPLSASRGKLDYYLLPLYPLAAVLVGVFFASQWTRLATRWSQAVCVLVACASLATTSLLALRLHEAWLPTTGWRTATAAIAVASAAALALVAWRPSPARVAGALALPTGLFFMLFAYVWAPAFHDAQPNRAIVRVVQRELAWRSDARVALCADPVRVHRDLIFETRMRSIESCRLWSVAAAHEPFLLLLRETEWNALSAAPNLRVAGAFLYLPARALGAGGILTSRPVRRLVLVANYPTGDPVAREVDERWRRAAQAGR